MKPNIAIMSAFSALSIALLSGCVKIWRDNLDIKTYMVEVGRPGEPRAKPLAGKLWIDSVTVLPPSNVRNLVLRESDVEFSTSYYTELLLAPAENFRNEFFAWFADSGIFGQVSIGGRTGSSHRLHATVMDFYGDKTTNEAVLRIRVALLDQQTKGDRVLLSKDYSERTNMETQDAGQLIRAYNTGLADILAQCEQDVVNALE